MWLALLVDLQVDVAQERGACLEYSVTLLLRVIPLVCLTL
jgi:hypothetical protein